MAPTEHQQALQAHVARFAKRHGYESDLVTVADLGDETFGLLETKSAVYLFSLPHDSPHVDVMALYGESATLTMLALARLGRCGWCKGTTKAASNWSPGTCPDCEVAQ